MQISPVSCLFISIRYKYSSHHNVLRHPHSMYIY
jgi:hypothetical protein